MGSITSERSFNPHRPVRAGASYALWLLAGVVQVSILTDPLGPVLLDTCYRVRMTDKASFNPHRPVRAGASNTMSTDTPNDDHVSILTDPLGPVLPPQHTTYCRGWGFFLVCANWMLSG